MAGLNKILLVTAFSIQLFYCRNTEFTCYAPPDFWSGECRSSQQKYPHTELTYYVTVNGDGNTIVCCKGYSEHAQDFLSIGCGMRSFNKRLYWGNTAGTPRINCRSVPPNGAPVTWEHRW